MSSQLASVLEHLAAQSVRRLGRDGGGKLNVA